MSNIQQRITDLQKEINADKELIEEKRRAFKQAFKAGKEKDVPVDLLNLENTLVHKLSVLDEYWEELRDEDEKEEAIQREKDKKAYNAVVKKRMKINDELEAALKVVIMKTSELADIDLQQRRLGNKIGLRMNRRPLQALERYCTANFKGILPIEGMRIPADLGKSINEIDVMAKYEPT